MKKLLLLLLFGFSLNGMSQSINFEYDIAGNQVKRFYLLSGRYSEQSVKEYNDLTNDDLQKFFPEDVISYYPNPVKDELYLEWELVNENKVLSIDIYNINGQLVRKINNISNNKTIISFQEYTTGTYIVNLNYFTGNQKSITIIKN